jgi:transposase
MELTYQEVYHMNPVQARKRIIHIYQQTQNYCETARRCHTSPQLVRKWVKRYQQYGEQGLHDLPKTPKRQPRKTDPDIEQRVLQLHQKTHYGRQRLARHLAQQGIHLSPHTIRHILKRHAPAPTRPRKPRRRFYPAHWAWESQEPFTLIQADVKDIYDKGTLGTERWDHLRKHRLPRYQWTFLESRTRLRLLAFRREMSTRHGMAFLSLAVSWLRLCGVPTERTIQTDWAGVRRGVGRTLTKSLAWRQSFCVRWGRGWGAFRWGAKRIMVVWSAVIGRMTRSFTCRACYRWTRWRRFWVRVWVGCIITTMSVCILGMGWRVGRRTGVVWRWVFRVRDM